MIVCWIRLFRVSPSRSLSPDLELCIELSLGSRRSGQRLSSAAVGLFLRSRTLGSKMRQINDSKEQCRNDRFGPLAAAALFLAPGAYFVYFVPIGA